MKECTAVESARRRLCLRMKKTIGKSVLEEQQFTFSKQKTKTYPREGRETDKRKLILSEQERGEGNLR